MSRDQILDTTWLEFLATWNAYVAEKSGPQRRTPRETPGGAPLSPGEQRIAADRGIIVRE